MTGTGWIGVDLDGTLAHYEDWKGHLHIGPPIPEMVERVRQWLVEGREVRIFTARVTDPAVRFEAIAAIQNWCVEHLGRRLPVTNVKDYDMVELWDDRCIQVESNTGIPVYPSVRVPGDLN